MSSKEKTMFLCRLALLTAAYFVLSITLTVKTPYLEITFKSLPVVVGALMFGPVGGVSGSTGQRYRQFTSTIAVLVIISTVVALTLWAQWPPPSPSGAAIWRSGL